MKHRWFRFIAAVAVIPLLSSGALAQDETSEMDKIRQQIREMEARHQAEMKALQDRVDAMSRAQPADAQEVTEMIDELGEEIDELRGLTDALRPGTTNFLVTGYAFTNFFDLDTEDSTFSAGFNPIFLWRMSDSLFMKAELELELEDGETETSLEYLDLSFVVNDYLTLSAGKFLTPLSNFKENLHPAWINKLPRQPMFASGGSRLIPTSSLGIQARGAIPIDEMKFTYAAYVSNGFTIQTDGSEAGKLKFKNFEDNNNSNRSALDSVSSPSTISNCSTRSTSAR